MRTTDTVRTIPATFDGLQGEIKRAVDARDALERGPLNAETAAEHDRLERRIDALLATRDSLFPAESAEYEAQAEADDAGRGGYFYDPSDWD